MPIIPTTVGPLTINGPAFFNAPVTIATPSGVVDALNVYGTSGNGAYAMIIQAGQAAGLSYGMLFRGGTTSTDSALLVQNAAATTKYFQVFGDGHSTLGPSPSIGMQLSVGGVATFSSSVGVKGPIPAVTAGQTDLGITTTATVITTAAGIALPALASTFWCVNVNGVAYGIPCFAL